MNNKQICKMAEKINIDWNKAFKRNYVGSRNVKYFVLKLLMNIIANKINLFAMISIWRHSIFKLKSKPQKIH